MPHCSAGLLAIDVFGLQDTCFSCGAPRDSGGRSGGDRGRRDRRRDESRDRGRRGRDRRGGGRRRRDYESEYEPLMNGGWWGSCVFWCNVTRLGKWFELAMSLGMMKCIYQTSRMQPSRLCHMSMSCGTVACVKSLLAGLITVYKPTVLRRFSVLQFLWSDFVSHLVLIPDSRAAIATSH